MDKIDLTGHSPAVAKLGRRMRTDSIAVHHLGIDANRDGVFTVEDAQEFFTKDPEGVATVTLPGSYASKLETIARWKANGIPAGYVGFVPYHFVVDAAGRAYRMLPPDVIGAHAGAWNSRSVAIAFLGDFTHGGPSDAEWAAGVGVARDVQMLYRGVLGHSLEVLGHDEINALLGLGAKGCPGPGFPLAAFKLAASAPWA